MTEPRKAAATPPDLSLYALAQVRIEQLLHDMPSCKKCDGLACKAPKRVMLGRSDWPACPVAMVSTPPWTDVVALYQGSQISALSDFPRCMSAWGFDALVQLRNAIRREDARQMKATSSPGGLPSYAGRRNKGG